MVSSTLSDFSDLSEAPVEDMNPYKLSTDIKIL